ncbi:MAG: TetR/AcrR family transcriptional regulator [Aeromicrobium sp.]|uniref:TetR/AcrR family transcriptional regulator n=1 Tax=Aeromicrobium sp. TaxID=1871063 RepID=UPI0039E6A413
MTVEPARITRAERQAQTRERLVEVARELFLADGYAATTLDKVAVAAGFSKGAVYSNFSGKEELCLAVLDDLHAEQIEGIVEAFSVKADLDGRIDAFVEWARRSVGSPRYTALEVEFAAAARHSPFVARELVKRHRDMRSAAAQLIARIAEQEGMELVLTPEEAATSLLSLGIGMGAMRSLDHTIDVGILATTMRSLVRFRPKA